jgi:TrmH family RNA methyltransferase
MPITSRANPRIKQIKRLLQRRDRDETGLFFAEGLQLVSEALAMGAEVEALVVAPELLSAEQAALVDSYASLPRLEVTAEVLNSISPKDGHQGLAAVIRQRWARLADLRLDGDAIWIALDQIGHPGSLGTILRVSDAVGGRGVILIGDSSDPYDPVAVRASLGAVFSQQLVRATFEEFAAWKSMQGAFVLGTSPRAEADYRQAQYRLPLVVLMGSRLGLTGGEQAICDMMVRIPMAGRVDSHHVAVAAALVLYEASDRQRVRAAG